MGRVRGMDRGRGGGGGTGRGRGMGRVVVEGIGGGCRGRCGGLGGWVCRGEQAGEVRAADLCREADETGQCLQVAAALGVRIGLLSLTLPLTLPLALPLATKHPTPKCLLIQTYWYSLLIQRQGPPSPPSSSCPPFPPVTFLPSIFEAALASVLKNFTGHRQAEKVFAALPFR